MRVQSTVLILICCLMEVPVFSQTSDLKIDEIMKGYEWIGHSPHTPYWSADSKVIYFQWNPSNNLSDSLYQFELDKANETNYSPQLLSESDRLFAPISKTSTNSTGGLITYEKYGDLFMKNNSNGKITQLTSTVDQESNPIFISNNRILFKKESNLFILDISDYNLSQISDFRKGEKPTTKEGQNRKWVKSDQQQTSIILANRQVKEKAKKQLNKKYNSKGPLKIYIGNKSISHLALSPKERFITYRLTNSISPSSTSIPNYITNSGYTEEIVARPKVGEFLNTYEFGIYDRQFDTSYIVAVSTIPGIKDFIKTNPKSKKKYKNELMRNVVILNPIWSDDGNSAIVVIRSLDNKDRWIMKLIPETGKLELVDRQNDPAWVGGPGIGSWNFSTGSLGWLSDNESIWFQSESTGYSHLCVMNTNNGRKQWITTGDFEIYNPILSKDKKWFYYSSNEVNSGERYFYKVPVGGGKSIRIVSLPGRNDVFLSPDEKQLAILNSRSNQPWELYFKNNKPASDPVKITNSQTPAFKKYKWRVPEYVTIKSADGFSIPARLYQPEESSKTGAGVIFVHGAGYLQNAHKWWSSYYREYMFHNFLVDHGYTVLDIDYRGSAGYGRDWRTAIYQHMGGKDLEDQLSGAKYLVNQIGINEQRIGIYGGSYGGFMTLMALFKHPGIFKAGAALRSVTDWAHYNHPYTSNILNTPASDSLAFTRSSPIYYAEGLQDALLICHGMIDTNVHYQDVVRLAQRLIELGKKNWELAVYPLEGHGFKETSSWVDEYNRIFNLFENNLNNQNE